MQKHSGRAKYSRHGTVANIGCTPPGRRQAGGEPAGVAVCGRGTGVLDGGRGRGDAADRLWPLHHRMAADRGDRAPAVAGRLARGIRQVPADPPIPPRQPGHEPRRFQGHLLVGMDASLPRPPHRRCLPLAVPLFPGYRTDSARTAGQAFRYLCTGGPAGIHRLVHGALRPRRPHRCEPIPAGPAPGARDCDLRRARLGGTVDRCAGGASGSHEGRSGGRGSGDHAARVRADPARRLRRRSESWAPPTTPGR